MAEYDSADCKILNFRLLQCIEIRLHKDYFSRYPGEAKRFLPAEETELAEYEREIQQNLEDQARQIPVGVLRTDGDTDLIQDGKQKKVQEVAREIRQQIRAASVPNTQRTTDFYDKVIQEGMKALLKALKEKPGELDKAKLDQSANTLETGLMSKPMQLEIDGSIPFQTFYTYAGISKNSWGGLKCGVNHDRLTVPKDETFLKLAVALRMPEDEMRNMLGERYFSWLEWQDYVLLAALDYLREGEQVLIVDDMIWMLDFFSGSDGMKRYTSIYADAEKQPEKNKQGRAEKARFNQNVAVEERLNLLKLKTSAGIRDEFYRRLHTETEQEASDNTQKDAAESYLASEKYMIINREFRTEAWEKILEPQLKTLLNSVGEKLSEKKKNEFFAAVTSVRPDGNAGLNKDQKPGIQKGWISGRKSTDIGLRNWNEDRKSLGIASMYRPSRDALLLLSSALQLDEEKMHELLGEQFFSWLKLEDVLILGVLDYCRKAFPDEPDQKGKEGGKKRISFIEITKGEKEEKEIKMEIASVEIMEEVLRFFKIPQKSR